MRGALVCLLATALALGGALLSASGAARADGPRHTRAQASIAAGDVGPHGAIGLEQPGERRRASGVVVPGLTIDRGVALVRADAGATGHATALARGVDVLGGRVVAYAARRTVDLGSDGTRRTGAVSGLRVDGRFLGDVDRPREIGFKGGRLILNTGASALRVVLDAPGARPRDVQVAVARVETVADAAPTPTATPTSTATADPTATAKPTVAAEKRHRRQRRQAASVRRRQASRVVRQRLTSDGYAFPVYGRATVADGFGAVRAAPIVTHEGDDIFAPFGSPVVAVRDGRLSQVGTLPISGNRLWVTSSGGDAFFYAHLSAFSTAARNGARVRAGTVLGYVGNTGDAEPTPPHLHFEVHPGGKRQDAVDPYPILTAWQGRQDVPPGAWLQRLGADPAERPGALVTVRDFIAG